MRKRNNYTKLNLYQKPSIKSQNITKLILIDKLEKNPIKTRQKYFPYKKSFSPTNSTSVTSPKNMSNSRQNKSLYTRIQNFNSDCKNITNYYKKLDYQKTMNKPITQAFIKCLNSFTKQKKTAYFDAIKKDSKNEIIVYTNDNYEYYQIQ